uniref:Uncharacterized protein n=1 Tax=Romanomermis culicivorax TaxID=13658 RepID=A0A915IY70_ROMCU
MHNEDHDRPPDISPPPVPRRSLHFQHFPSACSSRSFDRGQKCRSAAATVPCNNDPLSSASKYKASSSKNIADAAFETRNGGKNSLVRRSSGCVAIVESLSSATAAFHKRPGGGVVVQRRADTQPLSEGYESKIILKALAIARNDLDLARQILTEFASGFKSP